LHGQGIKHGDVKPENILINTETDQIKLADFGYADKNSSGQFEGEMGTPTYMAPEIFSGKKYDS
jgi:serine/threonine protein kinase